MLLGVIIIELLLFLFGYIDSNSLIAVLLSNGNWKELFSASGLMSSSNLILGATSLIGIYFKSQFLIFAPLVLFMMDFIFGMSAIIGFFPEPIGHIIFGLISFIFTWLAIEWWKNRDD